MEQQLPDCLHQSVELRPVNSSASWALPPNDQAQRTGPPSVALMIPEGAAAGRVRCSARLGAPQNIPAAFAVPATTMTTPKTV